MKRSLLLSAILSIVLLSAPLFADAAYIVADFESVGSGAAQSFTHDDVEPFKGTLQVTVTNTGTQAWGDFHFQIYDPLGTQDISNVHFIDASMQSYDGAWGSDPVYQAPVFVRPLDDWAIDNDVVGATMDLYFYNNPILPGETAVLSVMTDNTQSQVGFFGVMVYPTPVPEPATMALIGVGTLALLGRKK